SISPAKLPAGLLGMILLVATIENHVARHRLDVANVPALNWASAESLARKARSFEVLCLGSSLTTSGGLPRIIEQRLGKSTCNLAVMGGTAPANYYLLKRALESGAHPKAVVVDWQEMPVDRDDRWNFVALWKHVRLWPELLTLAECLDLSWTARDASF